MRKESLLNETCLSSSCESFQYTQAAAMMMMMKVWLLVNAPCGAFFLMNFKKFSPHFFLLFFPSHFHEKEFSQLNDSKNKKFCGDEQGNMSLENLFM